MKRYLVQLAACCIWLVMFGVSCATTQRTAETGQLEAGDNQTGAASAEAAAATQGEDEAALEKKAAIPNVSVNIVQVNKDEFQTKKEDGSAAKTDAEGVEESDLSAEQQPAPQKVAAVPEMAAVGEAEAAVAEPAQFIRARRAPSSFKVIQYMPDTSNSLGTESLLSEISKEIAGKVFYELQEEGERNFTAKVAVVNAVPLSDFKRETEFGRIMGEYLLTDLADRGLRVTELRMGQEINILPQTGEFIMTRNIGEIANNSPELDFVVISTFSNTRKTLIVQGRLVSLKDGLVKTTWRYGLPLNRELLGLFHEVEKPFTIAVKGMYK